MNVTGMISNEADSISGTHDRGLVQPEVMQLCVER